MVGLVVSTCSATAEELVVPKVSALLCSLRRCSKVRPVWPMYTSGYDAHGTWYTTPGLCMGGMGSFGWTSSCLSVWCGLKQVRISSGVKILRIVSDMCHTYGRTTVALGLFTVSGLLVGLDWLLMNLAG